MGIYGEIYKISFKSMMHIDLKGTDTPGRASTYSRVQQRVCRHCSCEGFSLRPKRQPTGSQASSIDLFRGFLNPLPINPSLLNLTSLKCIKIRSMENPPEAKPHLPQFFWPLSYIAFIIFILHVYILGTRRKSIISLCLVA